MKIQVFQSPSILEMAEEMQYGGKVKPRKMFAGGMGGYELPENLQKLIGVSPENLTGNVIEDEAEETVSASPISVDASTPVTVDENLLNFTPAQIARMGEDLAIPYIEGMPTTEGAAEWLYGFNDPYIDPGQNPTTQTQTETTETAPTEEVIEQTVEELIAEGTLTAEQIQELIDGGGLTKENVLSMLEGGFQFSEEQYAQLFEQGLLTRDEIATLVDEAIAASQEEGETELSEEEIAEIAASSGMTEEQINELISQQIGGQDMTQFVTQPQLQEQISGLEGLFQNYLTPDQLQGYLDEQGTGFDQTIQELQNKLGTLEQQYQDVTSQYEADAVENQIAQTKDELGNYFARSAPTGPRTGSTSQFSSGSSFLPGGSPMANLIGQQREGQGQDPFSTYLKTFTPSYSDYDAPFTAEEYGKRNQPLIGTQYSNPFTGGASYTGANGGQVSSNGIMDLTDFNTNVQPFQNAFRPNKPRT